MGSLKRLPRGICLGLLGSALACDLDSRTVGVGTAEPDAESPARDSGGLPPPVVTDQDATPGEDATPPAVPCDSCTPSDACATGGPTTACTVDSLAGQCTTGGQCVEFCVLDLSNVDECLVE